MSKKLQLIKCFTAVLVVSVTSFPADSTAISQNSLKPADDIDSASTIIVTATRRAQQSRWISDDHTVLQVEQESKTSSKSVSEMLADRVPAFMSDYGGVGGLKKISLRGAGSERTLVLVDGKRIGSSDNDLGDIAVEAVKKIEVVEGGQSALYGMDAVGGVVNVITRDPSADGTTGSFSTTMCSYEPNDGREPGLNNKVFQTAISSRQGAASGLVAGNWSASDGKFDYPGSGDRYAVRDFNSSWNTGIFSRAGYTKERYSLSATGSFSDRFIRNPGSLLWPVPGTSRKWIGSGGIDGSWKAADFFTLRGAGALGRDRILFLQKDTSQGKNSAHLHFNGSGELTGEFTFNKLLVTSGVEYRRESMISSDIGTRVFNQTGVFAGAVGKVDGGLVAFQVMPMVRGDFSGIFGASVNGKIGGVVSAAVTGTPSFYVNIGTASRTPTFNDLYWPIDIYGMVGNPSLKTEHSTNVDLGLGFRAVSGPAAAAIRITGYRMRMEDMIIWQPDPADPTGMRWSPRNLAQASIRGLHGAVDYSFGKIYTGTIGATWNDARDNKSKNVLIYRPEYAVAYTQSATMGRVSAGMTCRYMSRVFTNDQNTGALPDCTVFDARLGAGLFSSLDEKTTVRLVYEALNLTNVRRSTNEGYPLPGREHRLSLKLSF